MSATTVENIDLATSYVSRNHSRCGCEAHYSQKRCEHCRPTVQICCLKVTRDGWVEDVLLARDTSGLAGQGGVSDDPWDTAWTTGSMCSDKGMTNLCGRVIQRWNTTASCLPGIYAEWLVAPDCETVSMQLKEIASGGFITQIAQWPDLPRDWYTSPLTATDEILGGTVTVAVCDTEDVPFPAVAPEELMLYGIEVDTEQPSPGRGLGVELCGEPYECPGEANTGGYFLRWEYSLETGEVTIQVFHDFGTFGVIVVASTSFPYVAGWADAYVDTPLVIPVDYFLGATHITTGEYHISKVASCAEEPPPEGCVPISCLPPCLLKDCDGTNYSKPLYLTVTGCPDLAALAPSTFPTVDGGGMQSGTFGYGPTSPPGEPPVAQILIQYSCGAAGLLREVFVDDTDGASYSTGQVLVSGACSGGSWQDTFTLDLFDCGITTFDVFSDGADPWEY